MGQVSLSFIGSSRPVSRVLASLFRLDRTGLDIVAQQIRVLDHNLYCNVGLLCSGHAHGGPQESAECTTCSALVGKQQIQVDVSDA